MPWPPPWPLLSRRQRLQRGIPRPPRRAHVEYVARVPAASSPAFQVPISIGVQACKVTLDVRRTADVVPIDLDELLQAGAALLEKYVGKEGVGRGVVMFGPGMRCVMGFS